MNRYIADGADADVKAESYCTATVVKTGPGLW